MNAAGPRWSALALMVLLIVQATPAHADARAEARRHFQDGMTLIREGNYEEGTRQLSEAYRILPHPAVLFNIGRAFYDAGQYERAVEELERYLATEPADEAEVVRLIETARARMREQPAEKPRPRRNQSCPRQIARGRPRDVQQELTSLRQQLQQIVERIDTLQGRCRRPTGRARAGHPRADDGSGDRSPAPAGGADFSAPVEPRADVSGGADVLPRADPYAFRSSSPRRATDRARLRRPPPSPS